MNEEQNIGMNPVEGNDNEFKGDDAPINMNTEVNNTLDQEDQLDKITIEDTEGNTMECEVLCEFTSDETNKHYIIYTANKEDQNGNIAVYASIVDETSEQPTLKPLEDEKDNEIVVGVIEDLKNFNDEQ
jgi:uncharacterized protein YrzB (UPF0473 family)